MPRGFQKDGHTIQLRSRWGEFRLVALSSIVFAMVFAVLSDSPEIPFSVW